MEIYILFETALRTIMEIRKDEKEIQDLKASYEKTCPTCEFEIEKQWLW